MERRLEYCRVHNVPHYKAQLEKREILETPKLINQLHDLVLFIALLGNFKLKWDRGEEKKWTDHNLLAEVLVALNIEGHH